MTTSTKTVLEQSIFNANRMVVKALFLVLVGVLFSFNARAQSKFVSINIPKVALVDVVGPTNTNISLGLTGPGEAGLGATNTSDSVLWLNYTYLKGSITQPKANIYAKISNGSLPTGMTMYLTAKAPVSYGLGVKGSSSGKVTLTSTNKKVVQDIKSCYTGVGPGKGSNLVYELDISGYNLVNYTSPIVLTITYTIME